MIKFKLKPSFCNSWPDFWVIVNGVEQYHEIIENELQIEVESETLTSIKFGMTNKKFGENGIWDSNPNEDKKIEIVEFVIKNIDCMDILLKSDFHINDSKSENTFGVIYYNGYYEFDIHEPIFTWITNQKWKINKANSNLSYFSNHTTLFHYGRDKELIHEIYKILEDVEKSSN